jgi:hypothetical protein
VPANERLVAAEQLCGMMTDEDFSNTWQQTPTQVKEELRTMLFSCLETNSEIGIALSQVLAAMLVLDIINDEYDQNTLIHLRLGGISSH